MTKQQVLVGVLEEFFSESQIDYILSLLYSWTGNYDDVENWLHSPIPGRDRERFSNKLRSFNKLP